MKEVALIFPGQGAQTVGMGREFFDQSEPAKAIFEQADQVVPGLTDVIFEGPQERLTETAFCQPGILTFSCAAYAALQDHPIFQTLKPRFACGLSLGEYSALNACGGLNFSDTLYLVERRSFFMDQCNKASDGAMAAVISSDVTMIDAVCQETGAQVANYNSPEQTVITGERSAVEKASALIKEKGAKRVIPLDVSGAFHSQLMQPAQDQFAQVVADIELIAPDFPILSNVDAEPTLAPIQIQSNLATQITSSVQWVKSIQAIASEGVTHFLEIGPGSVLKGLIRKIDRHLTVYNIQKPADIEALELALAT